MGTKQTLAIKVQIRFIQKVGNTTQQQHNYMGVAGTMFTFTNCVVFFFQLESADIATARTKWSVKVFH